MYFCQVFFVLFFSYPCECIFCFFSTMVPANTVIGPRIDVSFETVLRSIAKFSALTDFFKYLTKSINILTNTRAASFQSQILN